MSTETMRNDIKHSRFTTGRGWDECTLMIGDVGNHSVANACELLYARYREAMEEHGLSAATQAFSRVHLSDIANQRDAVTASRLYALLSRGAVSMIEQPPLYEGMMSLHTYHLIPRGRQLPDALDGQLRRAR
jgi:hypothetical protein